MSVGLLDEATARAEICRVGRSLFDRGYVHATAGNISVRLADGFLITPTDACLGFLEPDRLARLDADGRQVAGDRASKTIALHRRIYAATMASGSTAGCVIHTHSRSLVACSLKAFEGTKTLSEGAELLPPITPYFVMKVGRVPHIAYYRPGAEEAAEAVAQAIARHETGPDSRNGSGQVADPLGSAARHRLEGRGKRLPSRYPVATSTGRAAWVLALGDCQPSDCRGLATRTPSRRLRTQAFVSVCRAVRTQPWACLRFAATHRTAHSGARAHKSLRFAAKTLTCLD